MLTYIDAEATSNPSNLSPKVLNLKHPSVSTAPNTPYITIILIPQPPNPQPPNPPLSRGGPRALRPSSLATSDGARVPLVAAAAPRCAVPWSPRGHRMAPVRTGLGARLRHPGGVQKHLGRWEDGKETWENPGKIIDLR